MAAGDYWRVALQYCTNSPSLLQIEKELKLSIYMIHIDECMIEKEQCDDSCRNVLTKNNVPLGVYTNTTSFIGVSARVESKCTCASPPITKVCLNGGKNQSNIVIVFQYSNSFLNFKQFLFLI